MTAVFPSPSDATIAEAPPRPAAGTPWWRRILREPLTHFVLIGLAIFAIQQWLEARSSRYVIAIGPDAVRRVAETYAEQYGVAPDPAQLRSLLDQHVRETVYFREGQALGLDREDEIVRRRIAQKYEFLLQDRAAAREPREAELRAYYDAHRTRYASPARRSFDHVYYAIDRRGEAAAKALAERRASPGDAFPGPGVIRLLSQADTGRLFGGETFASGVFDAPRGRWSGPLRSGFGWHVVRVTEEQPAAVRSFEEARDDVRRDWRRDDGEARNRAEFARLLARYRVTGIEGNAVPADLAIRPHGETGE